MVQEVRVAPSSRGVRRSMEPQQHDKTTQEAPYLLVKVCSLNHLIKHPWILEVTYILVKDIGLSSGHSPTSNARTRSLTKPQNAEYRIRAAGQPLKQKQTNARYNLRRNNMKMQERLKQTLSHAPVAPCRRSCSAQAPGFRETQTEKVTP